MTILGTGSHDSIEIEVSSGGKGARIRAEDNDGDVAYVTLDSNHLQALEAAVRAARLELDARAISP